MTRTHEAYHAFTDPTKLVAKKPDHLTTCYTVESERVLFAQRSNHAENDQKFYMKAIVVPKNIVASICCSVESGISLAIAVNWRQNGSKEALWAQCGVLDLYRRRRIDFVILREDTDLMSRSIIERRLLNYEFEITYIAAANLILKMFSQFLSGYRSGFPGSCYR